MLKHITIAAIFGLLANLGTAYGEQSEKSYILVGGDCDKAADLRIYIDNSSLAKPYHAYVGEYDIVCAPFVKDVSQTRQYVELLRTAEPTANFVFVYDIKTEMQRLDLERFFVSEAGWSPLTARGYANVEKGYAVSTFEAEGPVHELSHLVLKEGNHCGVIDDPSVWGTC